MSEPGPDLYARADDLSAPTELAFARPIVARSLRRRLADLVMYPLLLSWLAPLVGQPALSGGLLGLVIGAAYFFYYRPSGVRPTITFGPEQLSLPDPIGRDRRVEVRYRDLTSFGLRGERQLYVVLGTERQVFAYAAEDLGSEEALEQLRREVLSRIARLPDGREVLAGLQDKSRALSEVMERPIRVTQALLLLIGLAFGLELWLGALPSILDTVKAAFSGGAFGETIANAEAMLRMGANAASLVKQGQWERLLVANFLHGGLLHLGMNAAALFALGGVLERMLGGARFLVVFLLTGVAGAAASAFLGSVPLSVGSSTALFGLLGAWLLFHLRFRALLPSAFVLSGGRWLLILGLNAALPLLVPVIDVWAHLGGLLAGVLVALALYPGADTKQLYTRPDPVALGLLLAVVASYGLAAATTARRYAQGPIPLLELQDILQIKDPSMLNNLAWMVVTQGEADPAALERARGLADRAVQASEDGVARRAYRDTLATTYFRMGQPQRAARLELQALKPGFDPAMVSQLARFLDASDALLRLDDPAAPQPQVQLSEAGLNVQLGGDQTRSLLLLVRRGDALAGLLRLDFEAPQVDQRVVLDRVTRLRLGKVDGLRPVLVSKQAKLWPPSPDARTLDTGAGDPVLFEFTPYSPEIRALPGAPNP